MRKCTHKYDLELIAERLNENVSGAAIGRELKIKNRSVFSSKLKSLIKEKKIIKTGVWSVNKEGG